jgi:hypothetical protein
MSKQQNIKGTEMDQRKKAALKQAYKQNPPQAGIFRITNMANGKMLIGKGLNVQGMLNGQQAQLRWGSHRNHDLQQDWKHYGAKQFTCDVVDYLDSNDDSEQTMQDDLAALEELWLDKLQPYGEKGYNRPHR